MIKDFEICEWCVEFRPIETIVTFKEGEFFEILDAELSLGRHRANSASPWRAGHGNPTPFHREDVPNGQLTRSPDGRGPLRLVRRAGRGRPSMGASHPMLNRVDRSHTLGAAPSGVHSDSHDSQEVA